MVRINGQAKLDAFGLVKLDGVLDFRASASEGLTVFADVSATIGAGAVAFTTDATGLLVIGKRGGVAGMALRLQLDSGIDLGSMASLTVNFDLTLNTFGQKIVYDVPDQFKAALDNDADHTTAPDRFANWQYTIGATPSTKPQWTGMYVELLGKGDLKLLDGALSLTGDFGIVVAQAGMEINVTAALDLPLLNPLAVTGTLGIVSGGLYGSL